MPGFLRVRDNLIVDQSGHPVVLRGVSLFWSQWQPTFFSVETLRWLRDDWGITVIRAPLGVHQAGYLENPAAERLKIETVIEAAVDLDLYVVVDWHAHDPEPEPASTFFSEIARRYGRYPNLIYETWNEPSHGYDWRTIKQHHAQVIEQIRAHDSTNIIVAGTPNWCRDVDIAANDPLPFQDIAYALHFYAASHRQPLRDKAERAIRSGAALMVTEWGTGKDDGDGPLDHREVTRWLAFLEKERISHINWSLSNRNESSAILKPAVQALAKWRKDEISESGRLVRRMLRQAAFPRSLRQAIFEML